MNNIGSVENVRSAEDVNAEMEAQANDGAWKPGTQVTTREVPAGTRARMVLSDYQVPSMTTDAPKLGSWGTNEVVPDQSFARNSLAIKAQYKPDLGSMTTVESTAPTRLNVGTVGPMDEVIGGNSVHYEGNVQQVELLDRTQWKPVGNMSTLK